MDDDDGYPVDAPQPPPPPPPPRPLLAIDAPRVTEGGAGTTAALRFMVTMDRTTPRAVTVSWEDAGSGTATAGAADAAGADYVTLVPGTLTFAPGTTEQTIEVTVIGDAVDEADETVAVRLHSPENATLPPEAAVGTGTITDDDDVDLMPTFGAAQVPAQRYMQDVEIAPLALPAATGGNGALTYTLTPVLPEGLTYTPPGDAAGGGVLAGTPAVPVAPAAWTLAATDADGDTATLTFTVEVVDRLRERLKGVNEAILADLSRAMTASTVDAVSGRIGQALAPDGAASGAMGSAEEMVSAFAGLLRSNEEALGEGAWSWRRGLDGRRFALALSGAGGEGAGAVSVWGAGDYRPLSGRESGVDWDGHLFGAHVGMDARFGAGGLAGLALSVSEGRLDYTDTSALALGKAVEGKYESRMTSAHPYLGWAWGRGTHAWASLGYGQGTIDVDDGEAGRQTSGSTLRSAAAGGSVRVFSGEGPRGLRPGGGGPEGGGVDDAAGSGGQRRAYRGVAGQDAPGAGVCGGVAGVRVGRWRGAHAVGGVGDAPRRGRGRERRGGGAWRRGGLRAPGAEAECGDGGPCAGGARGRGGRLERRGRGAAGAGVGPRAVAASCAVVW